MIQFPDIRKIKRFREQVGLSQTQLSRLVGVSQSAITKYENRVQVPSYSIGKKIFEILLNEEQKLDPPISSIYTTEVITVDKKKKFRDVLSIMKEQSISQIPVTYKGQIVGTISETSTLDKLDEYRTINELKDELIQDIMDDILPILPITSNYRQILPIVREFGAVLIMNGDKLLGIITKADLIGINYFI